MQQCISGRYFAQNPRHHFESPNQRWGPKLKEDCTGWNT